MIKKIFFRLPLWALLLTYCVFLGSPVVAGEFTADLIETTGNKIIEGKVYVKGNNLRNEIIGVDGKRVTILRNDVGLIWVLISEYNGYMEYQTVGTTENPLLMDPDEFESVAGKEYLGKENMNGYECDKYLYTYHDKSLGEVTRWFSRKLSAIIKMELQLPSGMINREYKNITEKKLPDSFFEIPEGYSKINMYGTGTP